MVPYLENGARDGIPAYEALTIIWDVQLRGCDLRGTEAARSIERLLTYDDLSPDVRIAAHGALTAIREKKHLAPGQLSVIKGGPCEAAAASKTFKENGSRLPAQAGVPTSSQRAR
jgi:hypothetical protein